MGDPTAAQKRGLAKLGLAMPDGSYYIRNGPVGASDLDNAIKAVGRGEPQDTHNAIRVHIMKRARALKLQDKIPADWNADGSLKHAVGPDPRVDSFLEHFGILGMRWGHHLPGVEALGGPGNGGNSGPSPFIQRGDHSGDKPGSASQDNGKSPEQQASDAMSAIQAYHDQAVKGAEAAKAEALNAIHQPEASPATAHPASVPASTPASAAKAPVKAATKAPAAKAKPKSSLTKKQATAAHAAAKTHQTKQTAVHKAAKAAHASHNAKTKAAKAKAAKAHAAHMNHLKNVAHKNHVAHQAHLKAIKGAVHIKTKLSELTAADKKALSKLSPADRNALAKLTPAERTALAKLTPAQRTALSKLTPKQKDALHKAQLASAKKRHDAAVARKVAAASAKATSTQHDALDHDQIGEFLEHHGIKGMKWGVRRNGGHPGRAESSQDHATVSAIKTKAKDAKGLHALTNEELQTAINRLNLENSYHRLTAEKSQFDKGHEFVKQVLGVAKTGIDAYNTGSQVVKIAGDVSKKAKKAA